MSNDYTMNNELETLMPKVIEKIGGVGMSEYKPVFTRKEYLEMPVCDTTHGYECLEVPDFSALMDAAPEDSLEQEVPGETEEPGAPEPTPQDQVPEVA